MFGLLQYVVFLELFLEERCAERLWCNAMLGSTSYPFRTDRFFVFLMFLFSHACSEPSPIFITRPFVRRSRHIQRCTMRARSARLFKIDGSFFIHFVFIELVLAKSKKITMTCHEAICEVMMLKTQMKMFITYIRTLTISSKIFVASFELLFVFQFRCLYWCLCGCS